MKLLKILLLLLIGTSLYAQQEYFITPKAVIGGQYSPTEIDSGISTILGDNYFRKVGGGEGNYPLTVQGLKDAIASLDSGTVYVSYPGLWDTTGVGTIPSSITLTGCFFGDYVIQTTRKFDATSQQSRYIFGDSDLDAYYTQLEAAKNNGKFIFYDKKLSWWGNLTAVHFQDGTEQVVHSNSRTLNADFIAMIETKSGQTTKSVMNLQSVLILNNNSGSGYASNPTITNVCSDMSLKNVKAGNLWWLKNYESVFNFGSGGAVTATQGGYGYSFRIGSVGSGASFGSTFYAFHSDLSTNVSKITGTKYHFYGLGNQPSFFGGRVEALNFKLSALNTAPATSTSTGTLGEIRIDANYIYICVATNTWKRVALNETTW